MSWSRAATGITLAECSGSRSNVFLLNAVLFCSWPLLKGMEMLSATKHDCYPRLPETILKMLFLYRNILGKQLPLAITCSKYGFQIASYTKSVNTLYKINYDGQSSRVLT